jgi:vacuolar-type H+-ATPase subunit B/Vma2
MKTFSNSPLSKRAGEVRLNFQGKSLEGYKILEIKDKAAAITEITVEVTLTHRDKILTEKFSVRMIHEGTKGNPKLRDEIDGNWQIIEHSFMPIYRII